LIIVGIYCPERKGWSSFSLESRRLCGREEVPFKEFLKHSKETTWRSGNTRQSDPGQGGPGA
jgi:hypothetical protein